MIVAEVVGLVVFYGISLQAAIIGLSDPRPGSRAHAFVWAAVAFTLGSASLWGLLWLHRAQPGAPTFMADERLLAVAITMVALGLVGVIAAFAVRRRQAAATEHPARHQAPLAEKLRFIKELSLPTWKSLDAPRYAQEDHQDASHMARILSVGAALLLFPAVLLLLAASILVNIRGNETSDFAAQTLGYYMLLIGTSWTIVFMITLLFIAVQQLLRNQSGQLSLTSVVVAIGTWAGFGAAGGVFLGALIPAVVVAIPRGPFHKLDVALLDTIAPDLLLNISTAGAVIGFILGLVISLLSYAQGEGNLFYRVVVPPALFGLLASLLGALGLRPGALSSHLARQYRADDIDGSVTGKDPFATSKAVDLSTSKGWGSLVDSFDRSGWNTAVDHRFYFYFTWVVVVLVILFGYSISLYKRELALVKQDGSQAVASNAKPAAAGTGGTSGAPCSPKPNRDTEPAPNRKTGHRQTGPEEGAEEGTEDAPGYGASRPS